jgi:protein-tyrosine sulfotransferase
MTGTSVHETQLPIFILSYMRSGSTLLRYILDTHPDVCSPGELDLGTLCASFRHIIEHLNGEPARDPLQDAEVKMGLNAETRKLVDKLMGNYTERQRKKRWCEKSPRNLFHMDLLNELFPDAQYICLHRHAMDRTQSCLVARKNGFIENPEYYLRNDGEINALIDSWIEYTEKLLRFEHANRSRCFRIRYESLVTRPAETLEPLFSFLGISWDPSLLDRIFSQPHAEGRGDIRIGYTNSIHTRSIGTSSSITIKSIDKVLLQKMNALLHELSYPTVGSDWDRVAASVLGVDRSSASVFQKIRARFSRKQMAADTEELFQAYFPNLLQIQIDKVREIGGSVKFVVAGAGGGSWLIDTELGGSIVRGDGIADSTITVSAKDLLDIVSGKLNPVDAFNDERVRVNGDFDRAVNLARLLLSTHPH